MTKKKVVDVGEVSVVEAKEEVIHTPKISKYREYWDTQIATIGTTVASLNEGTSTVLEIAGLNTLGKRNMWNSNGSTKDGSIKIDNMSHGRALQVLLIESDVKVDYSINGDGTKLTLKK